MVKAKGCKFYAESLNSKGETSKEKQGKVVRYYITPRKGMFGNIKLMKYLPSLERKDELEKSKEKSPNQMSIFDLEIEDVRIKNPDRIQNVEASSFVKIFNTYEEKDFEDYQIDKSYYINECYKIIKEIK